MRGNKNYNSRGGGDNYNGNSRGGHQHNGNSHNNRNNQNNNQNHNNSGPLTKLDIRGWRNSHAASNPDGGIDDLRSWLAKKAGRDVIKSYQQHDSLIISVRPDDVDRFTHLNNFSFAGAKITVQIFGNNQGGSNTNQQDNPNNSQNNKFNNQNGASKGGRAGHRNDSMQVEDESDAAGANKVEMALVAVIQRKYDPGSKFLNLSELPKCPEFVDIGLTSQPAAKVFSAIFVCCETKVFETPLKRQQMVESLSLSNNGLTTVKDCIAAAGTFNTIKNLDLSDNQISDVGELRYWRNRFPNLEHLILRGNPVDGPQTLEKMRQWYPKLKLYNTVPLEKIAAQIPAPEPVPAAQLNLLSNVDHPEIPAGSMYGQPAAGKPGDQVMKEQMALRFSYETRLKMQMSEECLQSNNWDYQKALNNLRDLTNQGQIQNSFMWSPPN